jgi:hypothetical protein
VRLGGLAAETSFGAGEILAMTRPEIDFWWAAVAAYRQSVRDQTGE